MCKIITVRGTQCKMKDYKDGLCKIHYEEEEYFKACDEVTREADERFEKEWWYED